MIGTKTLECLFNAVSAESNSYTIYKSYYERFKKKEIYILYSFFKKLMENELEHYEVFSDLLIKHGVEENEIGSTKIGFLNKDEEMAMLSESKILEEIAEEDYIHFMKIALEEGFEDVAQKFDQIASVERRHKEDLLYIMTNYESLFKKEEEVYWTCSKCGYVTLGEQPYEECPCCTEPKTFAYSKEDYLKIIL